MSNNSGNNLWLVMGAWSLGVMVSGIVFYTMFNRPVEAVDDIRDDLRIIRLILILILIMGVMIWLTGKIISTLI